MTPVVIGKSGKHPVKIDLPSLVYTRALVQASSGGGKSWSLRRLCELAAPHVQVIVIDPEGEFSTLREKFDFLLVGDEGELQPQVKSASLLAKKLMQLRISAVVDLYELKYADRRSFVAAFIDSLMHMPRKTWHDVMVIIDEAHVFAPEGGKKAVDSSEAVINLMTQGRKRGVGGVLATQRLSLLSKDAAAMCKNVLIGSTTLDVDLVRAGATLGLSGKDRNVLMHLDPGEFFAFGPAFDFKGVERLRVGNVVTQHPQPGKRREMSVPSPSKAIKSVLKEFEDLPDVAEQEIRDMQQAKAKIDDLRSTVRQLEIQLSKAGSMSDGESEKLRASAEAAQQQLAAYQTQTDAVIANLAEYANELASRISSVVAILTDIPSAPNVDVKDVVPVTLPKPAKREKKATFLPISSSGNGDVNSYSGIDKKMSMADRILAAVAWWVSAGVDCPTRAQVAIVAGAKQSGYFNNTISSLNTSDCVSYPKSGCVALSNAANVSIPPRPTYEDLCNRARVVIGDGLALKIFDVVAKGLVLTREDLAASVEYSQSGYFNNTISQLRTLGLLDYPDKGMVGPGPVLQGFMLTR